MIHWLPTSIGEFTVTVGVLDGVNPPTKQSYTLKVDALNYPPVFDTATLPDASTGVPYQPVILAGDANQNPVQFSLIGAPAGMSIQHAGVQTVNVGEVLAKGQVNWTPIHPGDYTFTVRVTDTHLTFTEKTFTVSVAQSNRDPSITSHPPQQVDVYSGYHYQVVATDPDQDILTYDLIQRPAGMNINAHTGVISWTPVEPMTAQVTL